MSRLNPPTSSELTKAQQEAHESINSGPRGGVFGPLGVWLWRPELANNAQKLGQYCRYDSSLPKRLSELAILVTGKYWEAEFEWQHHKPIALEAGLDANIIEAISKDDTPTFANSDEQSVYDLAMELYKTKKVSDKTYQAAIDVLGRDSVVDLVGVLGYYALISMTINVFEVDASGTNELT